MARLPYRDKSDLATEDQDLLVIKEYQRVQILNGESFLQYLSRLPEEDL